MNYTYKVYGLDVWGNAKDGYDVNDRYSIGTIPITVLAQCYVCETKDVYTACVEPINSEVNK